MSYRVADSDPERKRMKERTEKERERQEREREKKERERQRERERERVRAAPKLLSTGVSADDGCGTEHGAGRDQDPPGPPVLHRHPQHPG